MKYKVSRSPNLSHRLLIEEAIKANDGYCCCALEKTPDTKCMCKEFKETNATSFCHCERFYKTMEAPIVTLCGSTKFKEEFLKIQKKLTLKGYIVLSVGCFGHSGDDEALTEETKYMLDELHKAKIAMSDEIFVINVNGYIGESTQSEIDWAKKLIKKINYLEPVE